jgi:hypothetical protein
MGQGVKHLDASFVLVHGEMIEIRVKKHAFFIMAFLIFLWHTSQVTGN